MLELCILLWSVIVAMVSWLFGACAGYKVARQGFEEKRHDAAP